MASQKQYILKAQGRGVDITAHKLTSDEVGKVKSYCDDEGEDYDEISGHLEDVLEDYYQGSGNLWETGLVAIPESCEFYLEDDEGTVIFGPVKAGDGQDDIKTIPSEQAGRVIENKDEKQDTLVCIAFEKGVVSAWTFESAETPSVGDFAAQIARIDVDDFFDYVENIFFKGKAIERCNDEREDTEGTSITSKLL
jgi:hypothetical protein